MSDLDNRYETDKRDVESPPMPQYHPLTEPQQDARSGTSTQPSRRTPSIFEKPRRKPVVESHTDASQHNDGSHTRKLSSAVYNTVPINDTQQEATTLARPAYNASAYFLLVTDWWLLELVSFALSILSLMATIIILARYEGKPIYDWPYKITLNTVISVLSSITQVSLMLPVTSSLSQLKWLWFNEKPRPLVDFETIDSASRGPWGSLLLLGRLRSMHWASLGAVISILALSMPPFTQQLLASESVNTATTSASITSARNFTQYIGMRSPLYTGTLPQSMLAAIYTGMLKSDITLSDVTPDCQTGNCNWPLYDSLGVCASIANITNTVTVSCPGGEYGSRSCGYSVPGGAYLQDSDGELMMNLTSISDFSLVNSTAMKDIASVVGFYVIAVNPTSFEYLAYEASLQLCVQTLNSTVRDGRHTTAVVQQVVIPVHLYGSNPYTDNTTTVNGTAFTISTPSTTALRDATQELFTGQVDHVIQETDASTLAAGVLWAALFLNANGTVAETTNQRGFEDFLSSFAASISNAMRTPIPGSDDTHTVRGLGYSNVSFVRVHWPWLVPLVIVALLAALLLVATMLVSSRRRGMRVWKSSSVAVLAALQGLPRSELGRLERVTAMENRAGGVRVILDGEGRGLKLCREEDGCAIPLRGMP